MKRKRGNAKPKPQTPSLVGAIEVIPEVVGVNANYSSDDLLCEYDATMEDETSQDEPSMNDNQAAFERQFVANKRIKDKVNSMHNIKSPFMGNLSKLAASAPTKSSRGAVTYAEYGSRMETGTPRAETGMSGRQTDSEMGGEAVNGMTGFSPNGLREMIKSIIGDLSKEAGGIIANTSSGIAKNPFSNAPVFHPRGERTLQEVLPNQNPQNKEQELKAALLVIKKIMKMDAAEPFNAPVNPIALGIPDYFDVIDKPMDFGTICYNLETGYKYMNSEDVYKDVQHIWKNCTKYNKPGNHILGLMKRVKTNFIKYWTTAGLYTEQDQTTEESTMMGSVHRTGLSVRRVPDEVGVSHVQRHQQSSNYKQAYQPHKSSDEPNSPLGPAGVNASTIKESTMMGSIHRKGRSVRHVPDEVGASHVQRHQQSSNYKQAYQPHPSSDEPNSSLGPAGVNASTTKGSTMMGSIHRKGRSVPHVPDEVGASHVQRHQQSSTYKGAYQPQLSSNEPNSSLGPTGVHASTTKGNSHLQLSEEPNMRRSMRRRDHPVVPLSDKTKASQAQVFQPSAIENQPQMSSNQPQLSQQHTEVETSNAGYSLRSRRLQERPVDAVADSAEPRQVQFHGDSRMDNQPHISSNQPPLQVDVDTSVAVGRGSSRSGRGRGKLNRKNGRGGGRGTDTIAASTPVSPTTVSQRDAPDLLDDHATPANTVATPVNTLASPGTTPSTPHTGTGNLSNPHAIIAGNGHNGIGNEPVTPTEDVPSISTTLTGRVADVKCVCHGKIQLTISEDGKHFIGSTAPARSYRKLIHDHSTDFWPKWSLVDRDVKESWWADFQGAFCLPDYPFNVVRITWEKIGAVLYSSAIYDAHKHWKKTGGKKGWMKEDLFPKFVELWTDEDFQKKSEQASRNRSSNAHGAGKHTGGSIPFAEHLARMKRVRGEIDPVLAYNITHRKKGAKPNEFGPWVNAKSKQIFTEYVSLVGGSQPSNSDKSANTQTEPQAETLPETQPENIPWSGKHWDTAVGGVKRGGRVYGFGENISILDVGTDPNPVQTRRRFSFSSPITTPSSKQPMTRDDAVRIMQANPIFNEIIADTLAGKVSETVAGVGETVAEKVSETVVEKVSQTIDGKLIDLVRQLGVVMGGTSTSTDVLVEALRRVQAENGTTR